MTKARKKDLSPSVDEKFRSSLPRNRALPTEEHSDFSTRAGFLTHGSAPFVRLPPSIAESGCQSLGLDLGFPLTVAWAVEVFHPIPFYPNHSST